MAVRIDSVRFDASGNATIVASGGISFFIPLVRIPEIPGGVPVAGNTLEDEDPASAAILRIVEEEEARLRAISLCSRAEQSSIGLKAKLATRGFSRSAIHYATCELVRQGIVDDVRYASIWARIRAEHRLHGPMFIGSELRARGFSESTVKSVLLTIDFDSILEKAVMKELGGIVPQTPSKDFLDSLTKSLKLRGFKSESIRQFIEKMT